MQPPALEPSHPPRRPTLPSEHVLTPRRACLQVGAVAATAAITAATAATAAVAAVAAPARSATSLAISVATTSLATSLTALQGERSASDR